ncbi:MAG: PIN domain-containing protein [Candidatus Methanoperedens sp.]|nr:PIN domain-containing protein [Candidatus Methanoperedens sp.]
MNSMRDELVLIDSNLLSYVFDESEPKKRKICNELVADCWKRKRDLAVSVQNLSEFYVVVTKKISNPIPAKVAKDFIEHIIDFQGWHVLNYNAQTITSAIGISTKTGIYYWDALLAATMRENNVFSIYTENDMDFKKVPWLKTINPFA